MLYRTMPTSVLPVVFVCVLAVGCDRAQRTAGPVPAQAATSTAPSAPEVSYKGTDASAHPRGMAAEIVHPVWSPTDFKIRAQLRLTNHTTSPIRVCTFGQCWRTADQFGSASDVSFTPGFFKSDGPLGDDLPKFAREANSFAVIEHGKSFDVPIDFAVGKGAKGSVRLTASYAVIPEVAKILDIWEGNVSAEPVTFHY